MLRTSTILSSRSLFFSFFNDTAPTEIYTLSLHDALPIYRFVIESKRSPTPEMRITGPTATCKMGTRSIKRMWNTFPGYAKNAKDLTKHGEKLKLSSPMLGDRKSV